MQAKSSLIMRLSLLLTFLQAVLLVNAQTPSAVIQSTPETLQDSSFCSGTSITFTSASSNLSPAVSFLWDFGFNAAPSSASGPGPHLVEFTQSGFQMVALEVDNNNGMPPALDEVSFSIAPEPSSTLELISLGWDFDSFSDENGINFVRCNSSGDANFLFTVSDAGAYEHTFEWGDGSPNSTQADFANGTISHTYSLGGYTMIHSFSDLVSGCSSQEIYTVFNGSAPNISFQSSGTYSCLGEPFEVLLGSNGEIANYDLTFSDSTQISFTTSADTLIEHVFLTNSCGYETNSWSNAFMLEVIATNGCSSGISTDIEFDPIFVSSAPDVELISTICPGCSGTMFDLIDVSQNAVFVSPDGCSDSLHRFWTIDTNLDYVLDSGELGGSNGYIGSDYIFGGWNSGSASISITVDEPGLFGAWLYSGNACGYDSIYYSCEIQPAGDLTLDGNIGTSGPQNLTICSGDSVPDMTFDSSLSADTIYWSISTTGNIDGINEFSGSGPAPLVLPGWVLTNTSISSQTVEVLVGLGCDTGGIIITIEVLPVIDIYLGPPAVPDTICSGEELFVLVNTTVHSVDVVWTVDSLSEVTGGLDGSGPIIVDELSNAGSAVEILTYTFTTPFEQCPADTLVYDVAVVPEYDLPTPASLEACPDDFVVLSPYDVPYLGVQYGWFLMGDDVGLPIVGQDYLNDFTAQNDLAVDAMATLTLTSDLYGCMDSASIDVVVHPQPVLGVLSSNVISCSGADLGAIATSTVAGIELAWSTGSHPSISGMSSGQGAVPLSLNDVLINASNVLDSVLYTITTSNFVCPADPLEWYAVVAPEFTLSAVSDLQLCPGDSAFLPNYDLGFPEMSFEWVANGNDVGLGANGVGILESWQASNASDSTASSSVISLIGELYGCHDTTEFTAIVEPQPILNVSGLASPVCSGVPVNWVISTTVPEATGQWEPSGGTDLSGYTTGQGAIITDTLVNAGLNADSLVYVITTTGSYCAADTFFGGVTVLPNFVLPLLPDVVFCDGDQVSVPDYTLIIDSVSYSWTNSNSEIGLGAAGTGNLPDWVASNDGDSPIQATIDIESGLLNCPEQQTSFEVIINPTPQLSSNVGPNGGVDCQTGIATIEGFSALGPGSFSWTGPGNVDPMGSTAQVDASGTYTMDFIDDVTGCFASIELVVQDAAPIDFLNVSLDSLACFGDENGTILVDAVGGGELLYDWFPPISAGPIANNVAAGTYSVVVTNESNCQDSATVEMFERLPLEIELIDSGPSLCGEANGFIEVQANGGMEEYVYQWDNSSDQLLWGVGAGLHEITVTDAYGCVSSAIFELECFDEIPVGVNQIITPNNDGLNDALFLDDLYLYPQHRIRVFNRWGTLVYEASPYQNDWQGTWEANGSGEPLPSATYYFLIETQPTNPEVFRGFIEIQNEAR